MNLEFLAQFRKAMTAMHDFMPAFEKGLPVAVCRGDNEVQSTVDANDAFNAFYGNRRGLYFHRNTEIPVFALLDELTRAECPAFIKTFLPAIRGLKRHLDRTTQGRQG